MKNLKQKPYNLKRCRMLWVALVGCLFAAPNAQAVYSETRDRSVSMLKSLLSVGAGTRQERDLPQVSTQPVSYSHAVAEMAAGTYSHSDGYRYEIFSGYFGTPNTIVSTGTLQINKIEISTDAVTVVPIGKNFVMGVTLTSNITASFSSPIMVECTTCPIPGIKITAIQNHLGQPIQENISYRFIPTGNSSEGTETLAIRPPAAYQNSSEDGLWTANTLYDVNFITGAFGLRDVEGNQLNQEAHFYFSTVLNPNQNNVIVQPVEIENAYNEIPALIGVKAPIIKMQVPAEALKDTAAIFLNTNLSIYKPVVVSKQVMDEATRKAEKAQGAYRKPLGIHEVVALGISGERQMKLNKPITLSLSYANDVSRASRVSEASANSITRAPTLSLFSLDSDHQLWVKMAGTSNNPNEQMLEASFSQLPVLAIMGGASQSAQEVYVFPNPWRPFGPQAGSGAGQTGTTVDGMIFHNLPSECEIQIYTINGEKVWGQTHSDALNTGPQNGQERWVGKNHLGQTVASGVYLWHVRSAEDEKTGKLMIIR